MLTVLLLAWLWAAAAPDREAAMTRARRSFELSRAGRLAEAESEMRAAINLAPQDPLLHSALGGLLSQQGKIAESFDSFIKAVELAPENTVLRYATGRGGFGVWRTTPPASVVTGPGWRSLKISPAGFRSRDLLKRC